MLLQRYEYDNDLPKQPISDQIVADALRLLLNGKREAWATAEAGGFTAPKNPRGFRPEDFAIPEIEKALAYLEDGSDLTILEGEG
jgi:hypothetical protein